MDDTEGFRFSSRIRGGGSRNALAIALADRRAAGLPVLNLAESNPTRVGLGPDGDAALRALSDPASLRYEPDPKGLLQARTAISSSGGGLVPPERLFLTASTSEAYGWLFKLLCDPGDAVLVPTPGYPLFDYLAALECVDVARYRLEYDHPGGWRIDLHSVREALDARPVRALVVIHPNNPTGSYVRDAERRELVALCAERGVAIVADEVFRSFGVEDEPAPGFAGERDSLTFALDGFSKSLALPQMKLGWIAVSGPEPAAAAACERLDIVADSYLSAGAPAMNAAPRLLAMGEGVRARVAARTRANIASARALLEGTDTPYRVLRCSGGWSAVIEVPRVRSDEELALELLARDGVYLHPGFLYDFERDGHLVVSLIVPEEDFAAGIAAVRGRLDSLL